MPEPIQQPPPLYVQEGRRTRIDLFEDAITDRTRNEKAPQLSNTEKLTAFFHQVLSLARRRRGEDTQPPMKIELFEDAIPRKPMTELEK